MSQRRDEFVALLVIGQRTARQRTGEQFEELGIDDGTALVVGQRPLLRLFIRRLRG
jgi:hypothetical protein